MVNFTCMFSCDENIGLTAIAALSLPPFAAHHYHFIFFVFLNVLRQVCSGVKIR